MGRNDEVLRTLLYSDLFDYPLRKEEIWNYLIAESPINVENFSRQFKDKRIQEKNGFYFVKGREEILKIREQREKESLKKIKKAQKIAFILSLIPTVELIGVSGSLSLKNSDKEEDIDFFIITSKDSLWITRFFLVSFLKLFGLSRKKKSKKVENKFCLNMFLSFNNMQLPKNKRNLFLAHEIAQLLPIANKGKTYQSFMKQNNWTQAFLPNVKKRQVILQKKENKFLKSIFKKLDTYFFEIQLKIMSKDITVEEVSKTTAAFHPIDQGSLIMRKYNTQLKKYEI